MDEAGGNYVLLENGVDGEVLMDRLGQKRQFDVVIRGSFAGQQMLGVIECKDLKRRVGTPEVDAFVTKSQDINANIKLLISRRGFSNTALTKCKHYGIQPLSLINDSANFGFLVGTRWEADVSRWNKISLSIFPTQPYMCPESFRPEELTVQGRKVYDWFTNYLLDNNDNIEGFGWVVAIRIEFNEPQSVAIRKGTEYLCNAITFRAERVCDKLERIVGINGPGFFNWRTQEVTLPSNAQIHWDGVPMDFTQWQPRTDVNDPKPLLEIRLIVRAIQFEKIPDVIALDRLGRLVSA